MMYLGLLTTIGVKLRRLIESSQNRMFDTDRIDFLTHSYEPLF